MGERLNGIQEASGSIPLISTIKKNLENIGFQGFFLFPPQYGTSKAYKRQPELQFAKKFLYSRNARPIKGNGCSGKFYLNKNLQFVFFLSEKYGII